MLNLTTVTNYRKQLEAISASAVGVVIVAVRVIRGTNAVDEFLDLDTAGRTDTSGTCQYVAVTDGVEITFHRLATVCNVERINDENFYTLLIYSFIKW